MEYNSIDLLNKCLGCNGKGRVKCDCDTFDEPNKNCVTCRGEGNFICPICEGEGRF